MMSRPFAAALLAASLMAAPDAFAADAPVAPAKPVFAQGSMNVYRRFPPEIRDRMIEFYNQVVGLPSLNPINLGRGQQMLLYKVGTGQVKLASGLNEGRKYHPAGPTEATGIRSYTFYFPDEAPLVARFKAAGYPAPVFKDIGGGRRGAL